MSSVLVLNSTYEPMNVAAWQRAVELIFAGKAEAIHNTAKQLRSAGGFAIPMPSIIRMLYFVRRKPKRVALTKKNVLLRDDYRCGYCGERSERATMTVDHVVPRAAGGKSVWANLVAACATCNGRKRDRTPEQARMPLRRRLGEPRFIPFVIVRRHTSDEEWVKYLSLWSVSIEERVSCK
jgi:5-methylcytosine-specific restriction endonuclease McrA